jgi:RNA polymerase sigma-70 factor (ECF subfamily)
MDSPNTPHSLLEQARDCSDAAAWQRLADLYVPLIRRWLRPYLLQTADTDDLVQEVLATLARELPSFERQPGPGVFRSWLRTITVHRLRTYWQRRDRRPAAVGGTDILAAFEQLEDPSSALSRAWDEEHDRHVVKTLLEAIRSEFRPTTWRAFEATALEGRPVAEVAADLGLSPNAVLLAKSRVLNRLRKRGQGLVE